jgi:hypothetical protein
MKRDTRPDRKGPQASAAGRSAIPRPGVPADFADMLSSLPDADRDQLPAGVEEVLFADPPPARIPAARGSAVSPPHRPAPGFAAGAVGRSRSAVQVRKPATDRPATVEEYGDEIDGETITRQILEHLETHGLTTSSQLRIEVHKGVVVVAGEVPTPYEKQLVAHFCRQVPGVARFVDGMTVRESWPAPAAPVRRAARRAIQWRLPFRLWHAGLAAAAALLVWGAFALGIGRGGPERLAVYPVSGTLLVAGEPAVGATIVLYPEDPSLSARPRATVEPDGSIVVTTYEFGDGAPAGEYKATVEWRRAVEGQEPGGDNLPPPNVLPAAYASPRTTPVKLIVEEEENEFPALNFPN